MKLSNKDKTSFLYNSNKLDNINIPLSNYNNVSTVPEVKGHWKALEYMLKNSKQSLTAIRILFMHKLLTKDLIESKYCGKYRDIHAFVGGDTGTWPLMIKKDMREFTKMAKKAKTLTEVWDCHYEFERIHPFVSGNGRIGRLILNWLCLKNKLPFQVVLFENKSAYYHQIKLYRVHKSFMNNEFFNKN